LTQPSRTNYQRCESLSRKKDVLTLPVNVFQVAELLAQLNDEQREAAMQIDGRFLVLASAGSGKTKTLTVRLANLMANSIDPSRIFVATFTNKAAKEMKERLSRIVGEKDMNRVWMGTFHSLCVRILRRHGDRLGYEKKGGRCSFVIYDGYDQLQLIKRIYKAMGIDGRYKPGVAMHYIDTAKNKLQAADYCLLHEAEGEVNEVMAQVYMRYQLMLQEANAMDFDDLIMNTVQLLTQYPDVASYWQNKFEYVMCDEYQDTNPAQFHLLKKLAEPQNNIFVVGDADQSIYGFRGSDIRIIMSFEKTFAPCQVIKLEKNYRSTDHIVKASNALIANNKNPYAKESVSNRGGGKPLKIVQLEDEYKEAAFVGAVIKRTMLADKSYKWSDFAVLYRNGYQSGVFEQLMVNNFIPYKVIGNSGFFEREEIKDLTCYLRLIYNRKDDAAMLRVLNKPSRSLGKTTQEKIEKFSSNHQISIYKALKMADEISGLNKRTLAAIHTFLVMLDDLETKLDSNLSLSHFIQYVTDYTGLSHLYKVRAEKNKDEDDKLENLNEFIKMAGHYEEENPEKFLDEFLQELSLITDTDTEDGEKNTVHLMTIHASKGLEFRYVFVVGCNELIFPGWRSQNDTDLKEERRLMYVAITRAKDDLCISYVNKRQRPDGRGQQAYKPSRFIAEIPETMKKELFF
jgi:DNA helicase-2/ATP-dependent DNA helicase PcrA